MKGIGGTKTSIIQNPDGSPVVDDNPLPVKITDGTNIANVSSDGQLHVVMEGKVDPNNSTVEILNPGELYEGDPTNIAGYSGIGINITSNVDSATKGLVIQFSKDSNTWFDGEAYTYLANSQKFFTPPTQSEYYRMHYTNGGTIQGSFDLHVIIKKSPFKWSSHNIADTIVDEDDAELVTNVNKAKSALTGDYENITSYREALNVNSAWVHRKIVNETFHQHTANITNPASPISEGDTSFIVDSATGFATGDQVKIEETGLQEIGIITLTDVTGTTFTLDRPISNDYTVAAEIIEVTTDISAVAGTLASPQIYEIDPPPATIWQITRILFSITDNLVPDDGKFGAIPALTNGLVLRAITSAGRVVSFANWKTNGDMKLDMYDVIYSDRAPAGNYGVNGRWTFTKAEVVAELDGNGEPLQKMQVLVQDDLTDLLTFTMRAQGRVFSP